MSDPDSAFPGYEGSYCVACGFTNFPASEVCPSCLDQTIEARALSRSGLLYSFSSLRVGENTVFVGYVDLPERVRVFGRIASATPNWRPVCDMPVRLQAVQTVEAGPRFVFVHDDEGRSDG